MIRLFYLFFSRNVLHFGILSYRFVRYLIGGLAMVLLVYLIALMTAFFHSAGSTVEQTTVVLDTYCCSVIMLTFLVFLFMKILFMKKGMFLTVTQQMPVTQKERNTAILVYEMSMTLLLVMILSSVMSVAALLHNGIGMLPRVICNVLFLGITAFFALELVYNLLAAVIRFFELESIENILLLCFLFLLFYAIYSVLLPEMLQTILFGYQDGKETSRYVFFAYCMEKIGFVLTTGLFLLMNLILVALILHLPSDVCSFRNSYICIGRRAGRMNGFRAIMYASARKVDFCSYYIIALFLYVILKIGGSDYASMALTLLTVDGIYAYEQSESLRQMFRQKEYSIGRDYLYLLGGQSAYIGLLSLPVAIVELVLGGALWTVFQMYLSIFCAILFFTMVGILFPAKQENPFSALVGMVFIVILAVMAGLLYLMVDNILAIALLAAVMLAGAVWISLAGMKKLYRERRYDGV